MKHTEQPFHISRTFPLWCVLVLLAVVSPLHAQKKTYSLDDVIPGGRHYHEHSPATLNRTALTKDYLIYYADNEWKCRSFRSPEKERTFLSSEAWKAMGAEAKMPYYFQESPDGSYLIAYSASPGYRYHLSLDGKEILAAYKVQVKEQSGAVLPSSSDGPLALSAGHNIYLIYKGQDAQAITTDGTHDIVYGEVPHRNEFGINQGMYWSPSGRYLAFYRMDQSMVSDYPLVDTQARVAKTNDIKYPMAGMASHEVTVGIYDTESQKTLYLKTGAPKDRYFTNLSWSPDEKLLYIDEVNRGQDTCRLIPYSVETGDPLPQVLEETHPKYIEPLHPIVFVGKDGKNFLRLSRNEGYNHLYLYTSKGRIIRQLTAGNWEIIHFYGVDPQGKYAYFSYDGGTPNELQLARVSLRGGKVQALTQTSGSHGVQANADLSAFLDRFSSIDEPCVTSLLLRKGQRWKSFELLRADNPDENYEMPAVRLGTIKDASGRYDLCYKITYPNNIPEGKKLPTIVYVYGGPHAQLVHNSWSLHRGWDVYMAQQGYVVFTVDGRGSANRGLDFENCTFRDLGTKEIKDQMEGIRYLKSLPFVDANRIGVHGWSYGGFMTTNLMLTHPETFKVGVAGGPVMDWSLYEVMYGERYMDRPQENPEGYKHNNLVDRAGDLKGRLLIIHGDQDPTVVWQHSIKFLKSCVNHRTYPDYMIYPGHEHNVIGKDRPHLYYTISRYFDDHLKSLKTNQ